MPPIQVWQPAVPTTDMPSAAKPHIRIPRIVMIDAPTGPLGRSNAQNHMVSLSARSWCELREFVENIGFPDCDDRASFAGFSRSPSLPGTTRLPGCFDFDYNAHIARGVRLRSKRTENTPLEPDPGHAGVGKRPCRRCSVGCLAVSDSPPGLAGGASQNRTPGQKPPPVNSPRSHGPSP
jgi:hypothetical protein